MIITIKPFEHYCLESHGCGDLIEKIGLRCKVRKYGIFIEDKMLTARPTKEQAVTLAKKRGFTVA